MGGADDGILPAASLERSATGSPEARFGRPRPAAATAAPVSMKSRRVIGMRESPGNGAYAYSRVPDWGALSRPDSLPLASRLHDYHLVGSRPAPGLALSPRNAGERAPPSGQTGRDTRVRRGRVAVRRGNVSRLHGDH